MHVDDCFKFERHHTLERRNQQNFLLDIIEQLFPMLYHFI